MRADPLPLLRKRTPVLPAVTSLLPVDVSARPPPSESVRAAAGMEVDAAWFDDEADAALAADRISAIVPADPSRASVASVASVPSDASVTPGLPASTDVTVVRRSVSYVKELFAVPEGAGALGAPGLHANDNVPESLAASYVRVRPSAEVAVVQRFLEEIGGAQFTLTMRLNELDRVAQRDGDALVPSTEAARFVLGARIAELDLLRDALNDLYLEAAAPEVADALAHDGVFTEYLRGVYAWAESILRALEVLNSELGTLSPDWFRMRARINDARDFYLAHLENEARGAVEALKRGSHPEAAILIRDLGARVDAVIRAAQGLLKGVSRRFA